MMMHESHRDHGWSADDTQVYGDSCGAGIQVATNIDNQYPHKVMNTRSVLMAFQKDSRSSSDANALAYNISSHLC